MLQTYKTSPESPLEFLPNSSSSVNFKHQAPNFNSLPQPIVCHLQEGLKQKTKIKSPTSKIHKTKWVQKKSKHTLKWCFVSVAFILLQQCPGVSKHTILKPKIAPRLLGHLLFHYLLIPGLTGWLELWKYPLIQVFNKEENHQKMRSTIRVKKCSTDPIDVGNNILSAYDPKHANMLISSACKKSEWQVLFSSFLV